MLNITDRVVSYHVRAGRGDAPAITCGEQTVTYADLEQRVHRAANALIGLGVGHGDRVLMRAANSIDYAVVFLGAMRIGAVAVPTNTLLQAREIDMISRNSDVVLALVDEGLRAVVDVAFESWPKAPRVLTTEAFSELAAAAGRELAPPATAADDYAFTVYTSGSTGAPKGVEHAHRVIVAAADPFVRHLGLGPDDHVLVPLQLASMITIAISLLFPLYVGARASLIRERFDPERFLDLVARQRCTMFMGVPTMFRMLLAMPDVEPRTHLSSARAALCGGEPLDQQTFHAFKERLGLEIFEMIGSTEALPYIANPLDRTPRIGSMGLETPGRKATIRDEDGRELGPGEVGHLCLRSDDPGLALGYRKCAEDWDAMHRHGWFYTGDLAHRDEDGYFWFVARADDVIVSRAYRISPAEVENALAEHPAVRESAVIGVADNAIGQRVRAVVVLKPGREPSDELEAELIGFVRSMIAPYKAPKEVVFVASLPKTHTGKIQRRQLAAEAAAAQVLQA